MAIDMPEAYHGLDQAFYFGQTAQASSSVSWPRSPPKRRAVGSAAVRRRAFTGVGDGLCFVGVGLGAGAVVVTVGGGGTGFGADTATL